MHDDNLKDSIQDKLDGLSTVEMLITDASAAIDDGNLKGALGGFQKALDLAMGIYGESPELDDLRTQIEEVRSLMENQTVSQN